MYSISNFYMRTFKFKRLKSSVQACASRYRNVVTAGREHKFEHNCFPFLLGAVGQTWGLPQGASTGKESATEQSPQTLNTFLSVAHTRG